MLPNPYTPGAGLIPGYLAGREEMLKKAAESIAAMAQGYPTRSVVYYGLRGVGKTVLLNKIESIAEANDVLYEHIEVSERSSFKAAIAFHVQKLMQQTSTKEQAKSFLHKTFAVLKAFQITYSPEGEIGFGLKDEIEAAVGVSDTGNFQNDLTELFVALGSLAQKNQRAVCLFIDEIQYLKEEEFEALIAAVHRCNQKGLPLALFGAGLPKVTKMAGDIKSYAERLFSFVSVDSLQEEAAWLALTEPAKVLGVSYTKDAVKKIVQVTRGYPYFIQEYGKQVWEFRTKQEISLSAVDAAYAAFEKSIDDSFFKVRYDRATPKEKTFMLAMAECEALPCTMSQIALKMESNVQSLSPVRNQLIHKGFIYSAGAGEVDFTVPQFKGYLMRRRNALE
ncbi:AAA family ATPase [Azotosporobacter soli]|uniref:AAA family ATPase n=1 Tax=Azotosporobacter soli TaxID=3055040 RepID=UPI0031FED624